CFSRAGICSLERLTVLLRVSFPAYQGIAFEPDTEAALFRLAVARLAVIGIVPAVAAEDVLQGGRAQQETHLLACHARLQALDLFGSDPVALLYVRAIRKTPFRTAAGGQGQRQHTARHAGTQRLVDFVRNSRHETPLIFQNE